MSFASAHELNKRRDRKLYNNGRKIFNAETRRVALVELGKTVLVTEKDGVKTYAFPPEQKLNESRPPRLSWLGGKQYSQQGDSRKNRSGRGPEQAEAWPENASRILATEIDKALLPPIPEFKQVTDTEIVRTAADTLIPGDGQ